MCVFIETNIYMYNVYTIAPIVAWFIVLSYKYMTIFFVIVKSFLFFSSFLLNFFSSSFSRIVNIRILLRSLFLCCFFFFLLYSFLFDNDNIL